MNAFIDVLIDLQHEELDRTNASAPAAPAEDFDLQAALASLTTKQLAATYAAIQAIAAQHAEQRAAQERKL
jgi:hypothetical protein